MIKLLQHTSLVILLTLNSLNAQESDRKNKYGVLSGQVRSFYMNTINKDSLRDFEALAVGGHMKYQYQVFENLKFGIAGYTSINTGIQDLSIPDLTTNRTSRYEEGLFDVTNVNKDVIVLLGELYLNYRLKNHNITLGRMKFNSPLVNGQDGRMTPSLFQGINYQFKPNAKNSYQIAVFNRIAPRSTSRFYNPGESIGTYPVGRNWEGKPSKYQGNTHSDFLAIVNANLAITKHIDLKAWNYYVDNISNSLYLKPKLTVSNKFDIQLEWLHQNKIGNGGNPIDSLQYFRANSSDLLGIQLNHKWKKTKSAVSISYNYILPHGQFIFPRSWGREFLFSFQKRERSEGSANNHAVVLYYNQGIDLNKSGTNIQSSLSVGHHWKPDVTNAFENKYAFPDYTQINLDLFLNSQKLKKFRPELLLVAKFSGSDVPNNPNLYFNKTDLFLINLILNYNF